MAATQAGKKRAKAAWAEVYDIEDLEQLKALSDPLRMRIIEAFCETERTTKQVAELLDEKPTKLYHHVEQLARVGLIVPTRTQPKRGTVEKYYRAVARAFRAAPGLLTGGAPEQREGVLAVLNTFLDKTRAELGAIVTSASAEQSLEQEGVVSFVEIRANDREIKRIRRTLERLLKSLQESDSDDETGQRRYRMMLAYYPLDL